MIVEGLHVTLSGFVAGGGPAVTFLHGFTQTGRSWLEAVERLGERWRCAVPDLRGHGTTRVARGAACSMDACAGDLELLWARIGVERTHLVGYSMGGRLALHVAATRPRRLASLLTIGAHAGLEDPQARAARRAEDEALAARIERDGVEPFVDAWARLPLFAGLGRRGPEFATALRAQRLENTAAGLACSLRGMGAGAMRPVWAELAGLGVPCTFVAGENDERYAAFARRLAQTVPGGRAEIVPDAGHAVHLERPDEFVRLLAAHLERAEASGASASSSTRE